MADGETDMPSSTENDPLRRTLTWIAAVASLSFATVGLANQNDPRLGPLFDRLNGGSERGRRRRRKREICGIWHESGSAGIAR